ncbi:hypothetical protein [Streptomyces sp. SGAir0957]
MAEIAAFMNEQEIPALEDGMAKTDGVPIMATPLAIGAGAKIAAAAVAFTIPVGAYVTGRVVN